MNISHLLNNIKTLLEPEKCEVCGETNDIVHECFCFERTFGYVLSEEGSKADEKIYMMRMKGLI